MESSPDYLLSSDSEDVEEEIEEESLKGRTTRKRKLPAHLNESVLDDNITRAGTPTTTCTYIVLGHSNNFFTHKAIPIK